MKRDQKDALRETISYKQHEKYIIEIRDFLCTHYRLNKSDIHKYLIQKEELFLRAKEGIILRWVIRN